MVCSDVAELIMGYVRDFQRYEKMEMLYQRYKKNFIYVYCPAVPIVIQRPIVSPPGSFHVLSD